jgi:hypothetical protein
MAEKSRFESIKTGSSLHTIKKTFSEMVEKRAEMKF